jgi:RNA polymerase sigma factor (sigma-70 family)
LTSDYLHIDNHLLIAIADGDEQAFAVLFKEILPKLQPAIMKWVEGEDAMKDVVQETFIRVWMNRDQLPGLEKPVNWIFRVAANECFTWLNKQALRNKKYKVLATDAEEPDGFDSLQTKETQQLINKAIERLPTHKRLIYEMSRNQGMKTADIALQLNLSPGHVRNALSSSLQFIREYLVAAGKIISLMAIFLK